MTDQKIYAAIARISSVSPNGWHMIERPAAKPPSPPPHHKARVPREEQKNAGKARAVGRVGGRDRRLRRPGHHGESAS
jgi:hypothetical protein